LVVKLIGAYIGSLIAGLVVGAAFAGIVYLYLWIMIK
jgi:hypothetical protein